MYSLSLPLEPRLRTNPALRDYARMEYGHADYAWFLAAARRPDREPVRRPPRRPFRLFARRPAPRPVACKGTPNRTPREVPTAP